MNFAQCQAYLEKLQVLGIKLGLDNVRAILDALGQPQDRYPLLHVAGTNGKGSVCAMLTRILTLHGHRVGLYTSPHLVSVLERIRIGDKLISRPEFCHGLTKVRKASERLVAAGKLASPPTHFEVLTCAALAHFRDKKVDIAVLETGMGGRFDATNVVRPLLAVITSIGRDHEMHLGRSLPQIAFEKAGIIKPGVPVICGVEKDVATAVIRKRARELGSPWLGVFDPPNRLTAVKGKAGYRFVYETPGRRHVFSPRLPGFHQGKNAAVALAAASLLSRTWKPLREILILQGIEETVWPGRLEVVRRSPRVILDSAHNLDGALAVKAYIKDFVRQPLVLLFAVMKDKDIPGLVRILFPLAQKIILTKFPFHRAAEPEDIVRKARSHAGRISIEGNTGRALRLAMSEARRLEGSLLVTGSLFLVGEVKKILSGDDD